MRNVISKDGTAIAYDETGKGPALILVDGALCYREYGPMGPLSALLAPHFTVFTYDRRGRGDSGDSAPYAIEREIEDIEALIDEAGGSAFLFGISSGAVIALEATSKIRSKVKRLALYEAPFIVDDSRPPIPEDYLTHLNELIAANRRSEAVKLFLKTVGMPAILIFIMSLMPGWSKGTAVAHTLPYDIIITQDNMRGKPLPAKRWASVTVPTLVVVGGKSPVWLKHGMQALAGILPDVQLRILPGQTHNINPNAIAPILEKFFDR